MWKILICVGLISSTAFAKNLVLKNDSRTIYIEEKSEWKLSKDLFGMPFIYFSPELNGQRSNISFTDTGADLSIDKDSVANTQDVYQDNKKKWASTVGATTESFLPYEVSKNKFGHTIHKIGFNYQHEGKSYTERSFYIECRGKILFSKSLRLKVNQVHDKDFNDLLQSLDCGGV
jgi:hypothetical protein